MATARAAWGSLQAGDRRWAWWFPLLAALLLWECLFGGQALLPTRYLLAMEPWRSELPRALGDVPPWNPLQWDGAAEFYPWRLLAAQSLREGVVPLWNPHELFGIPLLANSQSAPVYPPHWLLALIGPGDLAARLDWLAWLHLTLAGLFAYAWARRLGCRPSAAAVGGVAYQLSAFSTMWLSLPSFLEVGCWIPLALLALERVAHTRRPGWIAVAALALGLMLLGGHLQIAFYGLLAAIWWSGWLTLARGRTHGWRRGAARTAAALLLAGALGMLLAAPQLLPTLELSRQSHRVATLSAAGYAGYVSLAMPAWHWITLLLPDYYGMPLRGDFWGYWRYFSPNVMEYAGGIGVIGWVLAAVGVALGQRVHRGARALAGLAALSLLMAAGTPVDRLLYFHVPGFGQSGSPARVLVLLCVCGATLAALGGEALLRRWRWDDDDAPADRRALIWWIAAMAVVAVLIVALDRVALATAPRDIRAAVTSGLPELTRLASLRIAFAVLGLGGVLTLLLAAARRWGPLAPVRWALPLVWLLLIAAPQLVLARDNLNTSPNRWVFPVTPFLEQIAEQADAGRVAILNDRWSLIDAPPALMPPNAASVYGFDEVAGYDSLLPGRAKRFLDRLAQSPLGASPAENGNMAFAKGSASPLWPLAAASTVVRVDPNAASPVNRLRVTRDPNALPMAYLVYEWRVRPDAAAFIELERLAAEGPERLAQVAIVSDDTAGHLPAPTQPATQPPVATYSRSSAPRATVWFRTDQPALLVVSQTWDAGWEARLDRLDGRPPVPLPLRRVNTTFQGVFLPAGEGALLFRYEPASFRVGAFLGMLALLIVTALLSGGAAAERVPTEAEEERRLGLQAA